MRLISVDSAGKLRDGVGASDGGAVVVVGVKLDGDSKELLTWAMVKVAQPGDCVIAVHVLKEPNESTSSLLSLVKTFDSVLAVFEGFCNLKQVDLRLKLCRGQSVRKILVQEAESYTEAKVIVGTSKTPHTIRSSASVAKYCARKLPKSFLVLSVNNGKVVFERKATSSGVNRVQADINYGGLVHGPFSRYIVVPKAGKALLADNTNKESNDNSQKFDASYRMNLPEKKLISMLQEDSTTNLAEIPTENWREDNLLGSDPIQSTKDGTTSNAIVLKRNVPKSKSSWHFPSWHSSPNRQCQATVKNMNMYQWFSPSPYQDENYCSSMYRENGGIFQVEHEVSTLPFKILPIELEGIQDKYSSICRLFSYQELLTATSNFNPDNVVGKGGNSHVYRGYLPDGKELAVKVLKSSEDVLKEFVSEIEIVTRIHHQNIISLFGFCFEDNNLILVYDFLSRGSLEENLHGTKKDANSFDWQQRYKVAVGVAEALEYLHNCCDEPLIHRDVKSSNILLSDDFKPQLSDFGLANWISAFSNLTCTDVAGTFGYLAPEYFMHGKVSDKIDIYAYGVVLLELLSGRIPINSEYKGKESLVMWAKPILKCGKVSQLLDPSLGGDYNCDDVQRMVLAATLCIRSAPRLRPQISVVLKLLQGDQEITEWAREQASASEEVDAVDGESFPTNIQSHLNLALLDLEDDLLSVTSTEQNVPLEDYLKGRWSRTSSFD